MDKGTIIRTVVLFMSLFNQMGVAIGWWNPLPFTEQEIEMFVSTLITFVAGIWAWWKNNNMTDEAIVAQGYLDKLKGKKHEPKQF